MTKLSVIRVLAVAFAAVPSHGLPRGDGIRLEVSAVILPRISCGSAAHGDLRVDPCRSSAGATYRVLREPRRQTGDAKVARTRAGVVVLTIEP